MSKADPHLEPLDQKGVNAAMAAFNQTQASETNSPGVAMVAAIRAYLRHLPASGSGGEGEPVAWRWRYATSDGEWDGLQFDPPDSAKESRRHSGARFFSPLYAHPPTISEAMVERAWNAVGLLLDQIDYMVESGEADVDADDASVIQDIRDELAARAAFKPGEV